MLHNISRTIASFFVKKNYISEEQLATYTYCFEFLLSTGLFWVSIFSIAWISGNLVPTLLYYFSFYYFRSTIGGYHAKTHFRCYLISMGTYCLFLIMAYFFSNKWSIVIFFLILSDCLILCYAPLSHPNRPFSENDSIRFRKKSVYSMIIFTIIIFACLFLTYLQAAFYLSYGVAQASISLLVAYIKNSIERRRSL